MATATAPKPSRIRMSVVPPSNSVETRRSGTKAKVSLVIDTFSRLSSGIRTSRLAGTTAAATVNPAGLGSPRSSHTARAERRAGRGRTFPLFDALPSTGRRMRRPRGRPTGSRPSSPPGTRARRASVGALRLKASPRSTIKALDRDQADRIAELGQVEGRPTRNALEPVARRFDAAVLTESSCTDPPWTAL